MMPSKTQRQPVTKFYQEDIVQRVTDASSFGVVLRCWHDADDIQPIEAHTDPLMRVLKRGEVGVSFFPNHTREILSESEFMLLDRPMQAGDICKRRIEDMQSAVVTGVDVRFKVAHAVSGRKLDEWKTLSDVKDIDDVAVGDYVVYDDWVGQIQDMFDESTISISDGTLVRLPEISARLSVGDRGADILPGPPESGLGGLFAFFMGDVRPSADDTVVAVKHTAFAIGWMAVNQSLTPDEAANCQRPERFWSSSNISKLTLIRGPNDRLVRIGDKLALKRTPESFITKHGHPDDGAGTVVVDTFVVCETETTVTVLWQDGSKEKLRSTELVPYLNPDEYDCWPGDHIVWKNEDVKHSAVVQSVNAAERTADILLQDGRREIVSVLELDSQGVDANSSNPQEGFGVRRGDIVLIHHEGTTNGCEKPMVSSIGELEPWVYENPYVEENGEFTGWRKELDDLGQRIARIRGVEPVIDGSIKRPSSGESDIVWLGEVVDLRLDGLIEVALPDSKQIYVPLERLTRLNDGLEQLEGLWGDELSDGHDDSYYDDGGDDQPLEIQTDDGHWQVYSGDDEDDWVEEEVEGDLEEDKDSMDVDHADDIVPGAWPSMDAEDNFHSPMATSTPKNELESQEEDQEPQPIPVELDTPSRKRFDILPSAPADHAFYATATSQPSRQFLGRLSKEYRALTSSLPESIIVRTYEDRADLLRSMIIGPENTPYEDAPFVIDWMLDANFPQTPPIAHFLSWTNGNGRVNPNLYEEGKVCLSILGTWAGDRSESWSPARSSLLQALVSIQGLVLVKEPWFCEPAYEKWRDTDEGKVNSRLYNEKAYVLSRGFVRRALEIPLGDVDDVIKDIYISRGRLMKVIQSAQALIEKSKSSTEPEDDSDLAVPRLTGGGVITLTRTLDKLEGLLSGLREDLSSGSAF